MNAPEPVLLTAVPGLASASYFCPTCGFTTVVSRDDYDRHHCQPATRLVPVASLHLIMQRYLDGDTTRDTDSDRAVSNVLAWLDVSL